MMIMMTMAEILEKIQMKTAKVHGQMCIRSLKVKLSVHYYTITIQSMPELSAEKFTNQLTTVLTGH